MCVCVEPNLRKNLGWDLIGIGDDVARSSQIRKIAMVAAGTKLMKPLELCDVNERYMRIGPT